MTTATELDKVVTYSVELLSIKSQNPLITLSYKVM